MALVFLPIPAVIVGCLRFLLLDLFFSFWGLHLRHKKGAIMGWAASLLWSVSEPGVGGLKDGQDGGCLNRDSED